MVLLTPCEPHFPRRELLGLRENVGARSHATDPRRRSTPPGQSESVDLVRTLWAFFKVFSHPALIARGLCSPPLALEGDGIFMGRAHVGVFKIAGQERGRGSICVYISATSHSMPIYSRFELCFRLDKRASTGDENSNKHWHETLIMLLSGKHLRRAIKSPNSK